MPRGAPHVYFPGTQPHSTALGHSMYLLSRGLRSGFLRYMLTISPRRHVLRFFARHVVAINAPVSPETRVACGVKPLSLRLFAVQRVTALFAAREWARVLQLVHHFAPGARRAFRCA